MSIPNFKISFCPVCGKKLVKLENTDDIVCADISCRIRIHDHIISKLDIDEFAYIQDELPRQETKSKTFMLLKENLSAPMLVKMTNNICNTTKDTFCICVAEDKEDARQKFRQRFEYINITPDMVVPITIKEEI